jgi:hypothetical protein
MEEMRMVTITRTAAIAPGKLGDATAYANQIAGFVKEKYSQTIEVLMPFGGNPYRIAWRLNFESLAQLEAYVAKLGADPDYLAMSASGSANFLPGSVHDEIWRTI